MTLITTVNDRIHSMSFVRFTLLSTIRTWFQNLVKFCQKNLVIIYAVEIFDKCKLYYPEIEHLRFDSVRMKVHDIYVYMQPSILGR